jgi:hypothetical protein
LALQIIKRLILLWTEVYFGHHQCENLNDENSRSLSKLLNIGSHCEALETSFQMVPLAFWARQFGGKCLFSGFCFPCTGADANAHQKNPTKTHSSSAAIWQKIV